MKEKRDKARKMAMDLKHLHGKIHSVIAQEDHEKIEAAVKALFRTSREKRDEDPVFVQAREMANTLAYWIIENEKHLAKSSRSILSAAEMILEFTSRYGFAALDKPKKKTKAKAA